jgi:outer membrane protein TolC
MIFTFSSLPRIIDSKRFAAGVALIVSISGAPANCAESSAPAPAPALASGSAPAPANVPASQDEQSNNMVRSLSASAAAIINEDNPFLLERATATEPRRLFKLQECFDIADQNNKEIEVATATLTTSQAGIIIAKAIPNPLFSMQYGFGNSYRYIIAGNGQQFGWAEEVQIAGKRTKRTIVAKAQYLQTAFQVEAVRFDVHNRVRRAYAELAAAHAYADVLEAQREIAVRLLQISKMRFDAGKAPGSEVLQAKLSVQQFDTQRNQAWGRLVQDTAALALLLGRVANAGEIYNVEENGLFRFATVGDGLVPEPNRDLPPIEKLLPAAYQKRNDLKVAVQTAYANAKRVSLAKTQRFPDPILGFQYFFSTYKAFQYGYFDPVGVLPYLQAVYPGVSQFVQTFQNPNPRPNFVESAYYASVVNGGGAQSGQQAPMIRQDQVPAQNGYQVMYQQELPIFYHYQGQLAQARASLNLQLRQNDKLRAQIAADIVTGYEEVVVARNNMRRNKEQVLPAAARVSQLTNRGYQLGKMDLATAILAQQQYQQLLSAYFDSVVAYQGAWSDLEKAIGVPLI